MGNQKASCSYLYLQTRRLYLSSACPRTEIWSTAAIAATPYCCFHGLQQRPKKSLVKWMHIGLQEALGKKTKQGTS